MLAGMSGLSESFARIDRAHRHGQAAINLWEGLLKDNSGTSHIRQESNLIAVASISFAKPFGDSTPIALEIGEFFYQLRAALDGAIYKFASELNAPHAPADEEHLYFPIVKSQKAFKKSAFNANPFPQELKDWVESIQPYNIGNVSDTLQRSAAHWLGQLNSFCNIDKHRRLHVVAMGPGEITGHFLPPLGCEITFTEGINANFFEGEFEFLRFGVSEPPPATDGFIHVECEFTPQIIIEGFPLVPPWEGLRSMEGITRYIVERIDMVRKGTGLML